MTTVADIITVVTCSTCGVNYGTSEPNVRSYCPKADFQQPTVPPKRTRWWTTVQPPADVRLTEMTTLVCASCARPFLMPEAFDVRRRNDHRSFYCPRGHLQSYPESAADQALTTRLAKAEAALVVAQGEMKKMKEELDAAQKRAADAERGYGVVTRERRSFDPDA